MKKYYISLVFLFLTLANINIANAQGVNDFTITNYDISYKLSKNSSGRSVLDTTEKITANFIYKNVNRGIERKIPIKYDNRKLPLDIINVTDENSRPIEYTTYNFGDYTTIRIGNSNEYVLGSITYVISYRQYDVTKYYKDTDSDEWYWDTNGVEWRVPISNLNITISTDESIENSLHKGPFCYYGISGSTKRCKIEKSGDKYIVNQKGLNRFENVSISLGYKPGTFEQYQPSLLDNYLKFVKQLNLLAIQPLIPLSIYVYIRYVNTRDRSKERVPIVTEFIPPKNTSVSISAKLLGKSSRIFTAQLIDLAVRHYIKIYKLSDKTLFKPAQYEIETTKNINSLNDEEKEILLDLFGSSPKVGDRFALKAMASDRLVNTRFADNQEKLINYITNKYNLRQEDRIKSKWFKKIGLIISLTSLPILNIPFFISGIVLIILGFTLKPLTQKGLDLARYLDGLQKYINTAEIERLKELQSPEGAIKVGDVDTKNSKQLIKLYERVLPYAIIFGSEKQWSKNLEHLYQSTNTVPTWFYGYNGISLVYDFSNSLSSLSSSSNYNSISGGSSGGGSSGGGGGGGGGGGW